MTPTEIITKDAQKRGLNPSTILRSIHKHVLDGKGFLLHANDSALYAHYIDPHNVELHFFTEDSPLQLIDSLKKFISEIRKRPLHAVYGKADNEGIIRFLQKAGVDVKHSDKPKYNWMALV
jgi:hypothetical protein